MKPEAPVFAGQFLPDADSEREGWEARERVFAELGKLNLWPNVGQLDALGYTVLRPEQVAEPSFSWHLREALVACAQRRLGTAIDLESGYHQSSLQSPFGQVQFEATLLGEDRIFEQALMNETVLALITYLLGESCLLSHLSGFIKGPGAQYLPLHADQNQSSGPAPFPPYAQVANATWVLSEYTAAGGALCMLPGSHRLLRHPTPLEATNVKTFVPVECPAGSVVVWHGNTWHGALPRTIPGVRLSLVTYFNRWYHTGFEGLAVRPTSEMLARNSPRFARLVGADSEWLREPASARARALRTSLFA
jgi:hypothetical protein